MRDPRNPAVASHRFGRGHTVRLSKSLVLPKSVAGEYTIVALLPVRDGEFQYRIKSKLEPYERVVREDELV